MNADFHNTSQIICMLITLFYNLVCYSLNGRVWNAKLHICVHYRIAYIPFICVICKGDVAITRNHRKFNTSEDSGPLGPGAIWIVNGYLVLEEHAASISRVVGLPCRWRQQNPLTISDNLPVYTASNPRRLESSTSLQEVETYITVVSWKGC